MDKKRTKDASFPCKREYSLIEQAIKKLDL